MPEKNPINLDGTIEKITVPDDAAAEWVKTLTENGFSNKEIDDIMSHLNETYDQKLKKSEIEKEFKKIQEELKKKRGFDLSEEEATKIKQGIASRYL